MPYLYRHRRFLSVLGMAGVSFALAEEFAQEQFLVSHSVSGNGSALLLLSDAASPMDFLDWPAGTSPKGMASLEASTQPLFDGLSQATLGAAHYRYDANTHLFAMTGIIGTDGIGVRPLLRGTREERLNNPELRPEDCRDCPELQDKVYLGALNAQRRFHGFMPRTGLASQPIPLTLTAGLTSKYFWEELEGGDYAAQALNLDLGLQLQIALNYDPVSHASGRDLVIQVSGFELLPTALRSEMDGYVKEETGTRRWHVGMAWREAWPSLRSSTLVGVSQKTEGARWPGLAAEWNIRQAVYLRAGYDGLTWGSGISLRWRMLSAHYAMQKHPLGMTWYQVSLQADWPD